MAYKTILTVVIGRADPGPDLDALRAAVALARSEDAHLDVLAIGVDRSQVGYFYPGGSPALYQEALDRAAAEAAAAEGAARAILSAEDIRWGVESMAGQLPIMGDAVAERARFADLVVLPQPYGKGRGAEDEACVEAVLFHAGTPVLVLPEGRDTPPDPARIVVGWNQSPEALAAIRRAMPLLKRATLVDIVVVDPPRHGPERSDPGGTLAQMLARHGVRSEVAVLARTIDSTAQVLMNRAREFDADLVVMGAYGRSRLREALLGGATRDMLAKTTLPVFIAR
jgi:nucleotide-binding universal stress UspA family protein